MSLGWRGYIASRPVAGSRTAQHVQNLVIREQCRKHGLVFLLSATEYAMTHCYMMWDQLVAGCGREHAGIVAFSMFMLPQRAERRRQAYARILQAGGALHGALEDIVLTTEADIDRWEDVFAVHKATAAADVSPTGA